MTEMQLVSRQGGQFSGEGNTISQFIQVCQPYHWLCHSDIILLKSMTYLIEIVRVWSFSHFTFRKRKSFNKKCEFCKSFGRSFIQLWGLAQEALSLCVCSVCALLVDDQVMNRKAGRRLGFLGNDNETLNKFCNYGA